MKENAKGKHEFLKECEQEMVERMISVFDEEEIQMRIIKSEREEAWNEGWNEGWDRAMVEMAKKMIDMSMPADTIAYVCDLPIERVNALEREVRSGEMENRGYNYFVIAELKPDLTDEERELILDEIEKLKAKYHLMNLDSKTYCKMPPINELDDFGGVTFFFFALEDWKDYFARLEHYGVCEGSKHVAV